MVQDIRFAVGSVNNTVIRNRQLETPFIGHKLPLPERDTRRLEAELVPILDSMDDSLATKNHRSNTALRFVLWFLKELLLQ